MRIEIDKYGNRNEYADEDKWLYKDRCENNRYFTGIVLLGKEEKPWPECTQAEREKWEHEHQVPKPEETTEQL